MHERVHLISFLFEIETEGGQPMLQAVGVFPKTVLEVEQLLLLLPLIQVFIHDILEQADLIRAENAILLSHLPHSDFAVVQHVKFEILSSAMFHALHLFILLFLGWHVPANGLRAILSKIIHEPLLLLN